MCPACAAAYDRFQRSPKDTGDVISSMEWGAKRARWYTERKQQGLRVLLSPAERMAAMQFVRNELMIYKAKAWFFERERVAWVTTLLAKWIKREKKEAES